jgi:DNA (cytosine-5)-methyltransferase 1
MAAKFTYIDLFAGIGGFHAALFAMGGECVAAVEIDPRAAAIYEMNWGIPALADITELANDNGVKLPKHDVLVAGFPCQPFSKSGAQRGMEETRGTLYWNILKIIEKHHPAIVLLENVRNLAGPRHVHEWEVIIETLRAEGYRVSDTPAIFSPHLLDKKHGGRPQIRERVFIAATYVGKKLSQADLEVEPPVTNKPIAGWDPQNWSLSEDLLDVHDELPEESLLSKEEVKWIDAWDDFVLKMLKSRKGEKLHGFPLWSDSWVLPEDLVIEEGTPGWKIDFLQKNSNFYADHQKLIDSWKTKWKVAEFPPSRRKLEWQAQDAQSLWETVMHFRPSGIRAKKATYLPALVAITQTSIIGPEKRRLTTSEAARLQGFPDSFKFDGQSPAATFKQLGNGVNIGVVWHVLKQLAERDAKILTKRKPVLFEAISSAPASPDVALKKMRSARGKTK